MNKFFYNIINSIYEYFKEINIGLSDVHGIIDLTIFVNLKKFSCSCSYNYISKIINIPKTLTKLYCNDNIITTLDNLPNNIKIINCSCNKIQEFTKLPKKLVELNCDVNFIKNLDILKDNLELTNLSCSRNLLTELNFLPKNLKYLICNLNNLPKYLNELECNDNLIENLDSLPSELIKLSCCINNIKSLDNLPKNIKKLTLLRNPINQNNYTKTYVINLY